MVALTHPLPPVSEHVPVNVKSVFLQAALPPLDTHVGDVLSYTTASPVNFISLDVPMFPALSMYTLTSPITFPCVKVASDDGMV